MEVGSELESRRVCQNPGRNKRRNASTGPLLRFSQLEDAGNLPWGGWGDVLADGQAIEPVFAACFRKGQDNGGYLANEHSIGRQEEVMRAGT